MRIVLCYIAVTHGAQTENYASRFVATYHLHPPGIEHDTLIIGNGGPVSTALSLIFAGMGARVFPRCNDGGWDISAYLEAARGPCHDYELMLCCGESIYFHRAGWLKRMAEAWERHGPGMYGSLSSNLVRTHLNTTGFCCTPTALAEYREPVIDRKSRYAFEHGPQAFWRRVSRRGLPVKLVTWEGEYDPPQWRQPPDILWRGNQTNCLMWCQHTDRYRLAIPETQRRWARGADRPYQ